eukprot:PITA_33192
MKCLSFNYRGMASASKKVALRRLFEVDPIDIILLQETLGMTEHITSYLQSISPGWTFLVMDAVGRSGGLAIGYNHRTIRVSASWGGHGFIGIDLFSSKLGTNLRVVNIYGPCQQRENFWQHMLNLSILSSDNIILGGDLNFSLGFCKSWGSMAQVDSILGFMTNLLEQYNFVDVPMNNPLPTWRNMRVGEAALVRRLDRFLMKGSLLQLLHHYKQWVDSGGIFDHSPIYLEVLGSHPKPKSPFKFNHVWLQDPAYISMVTDFWVANPIDRSDSLAKGLCNNLSKLKHLSIKWAREKHMRFFNEDEAEELYAPVTTGELESTLKWFKKEKSPGLDGWTIEFYLSFYDLLGQDLLQVVEERRLSGSLYNAINSTFIALVPKSDTPSFDDYRPISLCNCLYKIISKIIANRL